MFFVIGKGSFSISDNVVLVLIAFYYIMGIKTIEGKQHWLCECTCTLLAEVVTILINLHTVLFFNWFDAAGSLIF